jgi:ADP-ribose pyrophosphatase
MVPIRVIKRTTIYQGRVIRLIREVLAVHGRRVVRETVQHPGAVVIVPVLDRSYIVFVRQYRRAIGRELLELPAGTIEVGERRQVCARRELQEETGWRARRMRQIGQFYAAPGFISEQLTIFLAQDLTCAKAQPEPDELVRPVVLSLETALAKIRSGAICDAKSIIGVLFADRLLRRSHRRAP